jgi:PAS domain S-box-containing protein
MAAQSSTLDQSRILLAGTADWIEQFAETLVARTEASVSTAKTGDDVVTRFHEGSIDCLVLGNEFSESTGLELLRSIRAETTTLPVLFCPAAGSETLASEAIAADVTEYVPMSDPSEAAFDEIVDCIDDSIRTARRTITRRERARQFDAIFHDSETATWVLDPDGTLTRVNRAARRMIDVDVEALVDRPFWTLPWWAGEPDTQADVRQIVETALDGSLGTASIPSGAAGEETQVFDLAARPVHDERGELVSVVVEAADVTDRVELERDLRQSEELHRVTLNNMTDTVLITDEAGEYTYVCPNVHFIFGYDVEELYELGTIEELLGPDLFDREQLAEEGVLKNIECTATDKDGREHTLLVNVREVSIQGGTLLYSCRDITTRKQREEALTTLQETARDFLYAETHQEIAQQVVDDTPSVLDLAASAVYLFDADENALRPAAATSTMERLHGPLDTVPATGEGAASHSFVADAPVFYDDVYEADRVDHRATELGSAAYIPLGDHGVFVAGARDSGAFDEVTRELTDLLAATAEAALDRVRRETTLREQDRELQQRNERLTTLNRINETIREIDQALLGAKRRSEIDHAVCELLTADDRFRFAWIGTVDSPSQTLEPQSWAGDEQGYLDSLSLQVATEGVEPAGRTAATTELTTVSNVAAGLREEEWRTNALSRDFLSVLSIPLVYNDLAYGVLTLYADQRAAFDETSRTVLSELGETIAAAISAIERKNALLTTSITRVEFTIGDPSFVLSRLAREADCTLSYQGGVQQTTDGTEIFVTVEDGQIDEVEGTGTALVAVDDVQRISADGTGGVLRLRLSRPFLAMELADHGAVVRRASATPETTTLVVDVPESVDVRHVRELLEETLTDIRLCSKQRIDQSAEHSPYSQFLDRVTDRQLEVVRTAYYSGFFESPRDSTGEEIAATLDISPPAFYQHMRTVQRKLFSALFDELTISQNALSGRVQ